MEGTHVMVDPMNPDTEDGTVLCRHLLALMTTPSAKQRDRHRNLSTAGT